MVMLRQQNDYYRPVDSLFSKTIDFIIWNLEFYVSDKGISVNNLPRHAKDKILHKFMLLPSLWQKVNLKKALEQLLHEDTRHIDFTAGSVDDNILSILGHCNQLREIYFLGNDSNLLTAEGLCRFFDKKSRVHMIKLSHCIAVNDDVINTIAINCTQLAGLELTGCRDITDKSMSALASLEYLKWINLANTEITDTGIKYLIEGKSGNQIKELRLNNCINVTSNILGNIAECCPKIEVLEFHNSQIADNTTTSLLEDHEFKNLKQLTWTIKWFLSNFLFRWRGW